MITRNQFEEIYPLVNEIVAFSDSFANEDNSLFRYFKTMGKVYGSNDLIKIIRSNILSDLLHCYFTLGYQQNYNSNCYVLFDLLQYAFWFDTNHFSYEDFVKYTSSQSNASYFLKGFNNAKRDKNSGLFPALCIDLIKVDQLKCVEYLSILKEIAIMLFKNTDEKTEQNKELINALLTDIESFSVSSDYINEGNQIDNRKYHMVTNEEYEELYLIARKVVRFVNLLTNKADWNSEFYKYLESKGYEFNSSFTLKDCVQTIIGKDILSCYFLLGYQQIYKRELYLLLDIIEHGFYIKKVPWSYNEFKNIYWQYGDYFCELFNIQKKNLKSTDFPILYIYLCEAGDTRADEYIGILQKIVTTLSINNHGTSYNEDSRIRVLLSNPQLFLNTHDNKELEQMNNETDVENNAEQLCDMEQLKDKRYFGISFSILGEEYIDDNNGLAIILRVKNHNSMKKEISLDVNYISTEVGVKRGFQAGAFFRGVGVCSSSLPSNAFIDLYVCFGADIIEANDGDRLELIVNYGVTNILLLRQKGQWGIIEETEPNIVINHMEKSTEQTDPHIVSNNLKKRIEHFEAIDEQFGITLQNFSVKVEDKNSLKLFCEVIALNGEVPKEGFNVEVAIYDSDNSIIYQTSISKYDGDFKGFEVFNFGTIWLDIPVEEISKIRIYPTR